MQDFDGIVIGSGAGGLAAAVALAQAGQKVLVLEQHYLPGGWCHSFTLEGYRFSPGVHYIGELGERGRFRRILERLGVSEDLVFLQLNPDGYDRVVAGDQRFDLPTGWDAMRERLCARFPQEAQGIRQYLDTMRRVSVELDGLMDLHGPLDVLALPLRARHLAWWGARSLDGLMNHCGLKDPFLRTILAVQGGDYALPPSRAAVAMHAAIVGHYAQGAWYPRGGGGALPKAFIRALRRAGGQIRVKARVQKILLEAGVGSRRAVGVRLADGTEIRSRWVLSNADPDLTYGQMIDPEHLSWRRRRSLAKARYSISALSLFLAVDLDLEALGLDSGNVWYSERPSIEELYQWADSPLDASDAPVPGLFLTVTTLKDRSKRKGTTHTMEAFSFVSHEAFQRWEQSTCGERPEDYEGLKRRLEGRMLATLERLIPGLREKVVFSALGTPLTNVHYVASPKGSLYGLEKSLSQIGPMAYSTGTEFPGLYLCGASTVGHGVFGAVISGLSAASNILKCPLRDVLRQSGPPLRTYPADHPEQWPPDLRGA